MGSFSREEMGENVFWRLQVGTSSFRETEVHFSQKNEHPFFRIGPQPPVEKNPADLTRLFHATCGLSAPTQCKAVLEVGAWR